MLGRDPRGLSALRESNAVVAVASAAKAAARKRALVLFDTCLLLGLPFASTTRAALLATDDDKCQAGVTRNHYYPLSILKLCSLQCYVQTEVLPPLQRAFKKRHQFFTGV